MNPKSLGIAGLMAPVGTCTDCGHCVQPFHLAGIHTRIGGLTTAYRTT